MAVAAVATRFEDLPPDALDLVRRCAAPSHDGLLLVCKSVRAALLSRAEPLLVVRAEEDASAVLAQRPRRDVIMLRRCEWPPEYKRVDSPLKSALRGALARGARVVHVTARASYVDRLLEDVPGLDANLQSMQCENSPWRFMTMGAGAFPALRRLRMDVKWLFITVDIPATVEELDLVTTLRLRLRVSAERCAGLRVLRVIHRAEHPHHSVRELLTISVSARAAHRLRVMVTPEACASSVEVLEVADLARC